MKHKHSPIIQLLALAAMLALSTQINAQTATYVELTPESELLDLEGQKMVSDWLPANFQYSATLLHRASDNDFDYSQFHADCDGINHTLVIAKTTEGYTVGGYNEGAWASPPGGDYISGLWENFIFSVELNLKLDAIGGANIIVHPDYGPNFVNLQIGENSFDNQLTNKVLSACGTFGNTQIDISLNYECPCQTNYCYAHLFDTNEPSPSLIADLLDYEVWRLNTSGPTTDEIGNIGVDLNNDGTPDYYENCYTHYTPVFPNSNILSVKEDVLLASYLDPSFQHVSSLLYSSQIHGTSTAAFMSALNSTQYTVLIAETNNGEIIGGYHQGEWSDQQQFLSNLNGNFLFNLSDKRKHNAIPGELHFVNGNSLPFFGETDLKFLESVVNGNVASQLGGGYSFESSSSQNQNEYGSIASTSEFIVTKLEVYKVTTAGPEVFFPIDDNDNGICDYLEIYGPLYECKDCLGDLNKDGTVTAGDLTLFLTVFGTECD